MQTLEGGTILTTAKSLNMAVDQAILVMGAAQKRFVGLLEEYLASQNIELIAGYREIRRTAGVKRLSQFVIDLSCHYFLLDLVFGGRTN